ncbi:MAG: type II toxin-antitoxin system VapC family toxin [Opitutaceae bacterium]|nr:type II toxin-antitoxin system VapC family toxin [Opitutaceae bacterium]
MIYLPDTNALSQFMRGKDRGLLRRFEANLGDCLLSTVVLMELEYGVARAPRPGKYRRNLDRLREALPYMATFDDEAAFHTGQLRAYLAGFRPNAQPIGPYDVMLAGQAISLGAIIVTHNRGEFTRAPGVRIEDWQDEP